MKLGTKCVLSISITLALILGISFTWIIQRQRYLLKEEIKKQAKILVKEVEITRKYLASVQDIINTDPISGNKVFKGLNPAKAGSEISHRISKSTPYIIRQISLKYRNPRNAPDDFETAILKTMEKQKPQDAFSRESLDANNKKILRYIDPLYIEEECLQCHGEPSGELDISGHKKEGYKIGDLRGAISIIAPLEPIYASLKTNIIILIGIASCSIGIVISVTFLLIRKLITRPIAKISHTMNAIASGDLAKRIHMNSRDEIGMLVTSINKMTEDLQKTTVSKAYVDNIIESMIDTLIVVDKNNKIKTVNKSTLKLLGYEEKDLIGKEVSIILPDKGNPIVNRRWDAISNEDVFKDYDITYRNRNNEDIPMHFCGRIMRNHEGEILGIVGVARDMRQIKKLISELSDFREATLYMLSDLEKTRLE